MGTNVDHLREGLNQYNDSLKKHLNLLQSDFDMLMNYYYQLSYEYEGRAAEQFKISWERTSTWFESYIENSQQLSTMLQERIDKLENV